MCPDFSPIYWQGSHDDRLAALVEDIRRPARRRVSLK